MRLHEEAVSLVERMTLEEKASLCAGRDYWHLAAIERLGLPSVMVTDGPHGLRKQSADADHLGIGDSVPATCFPAACATACSFDRALMREIGAAIGEECRAQEVAVLLGPGVNIKRSPLCGRNFEYFSEDPLLAGELAASFIQGVQSEQVGTSLKHFAANNQERLRMTTDSVVDERALYEIYFPAFETAIKKAQPWSVMCSYNRLHGVYASDNRRLLTDVLRNEWGFAGAVVSDWGATNDRIAGIRAGMDLEMPSSGPYNGQSIVAAVQNGTLSESDVDACAVRVTELILKSKQRQPLDCDLSAHHALARRAAAASAVLLKNEDGILPIRAGQSIAVIGTFAIHPRYQGAGSSKIHPLSIDSATDALRDAGFSPDFAKGYEIASDEPDEMLIAEACRASVGKDVAILFVGLPDRYESEGFDRTHIRLPESHTALIARVAETNPNTVVVLQCGSVVDCDWERYAKGILLPYLGGEATCGGAVDVLLGKVNPSGKLAESWCYRLEDNPSYRYFPGFPRSVEYRESIYVGYRYYDTANVPVRYPFGYGLSYTAFAYGNLRIDRTESDGETPVTLSVDVTNVGQTDGAEIVQVYVAPQIHDGIFRPAQELRAFEKVQLAVGETKTVSFTLDRRAFAYFNTDVHDWCVENGAYEIRVAASSSDVRARGTVTMRTQSPVPAPDYRIAAACYDHPTADFAVSDEAFVALLSRPLPQREMAAGEPFTRNSTMEEIQRCRLGRLMVRIIRAVGDKMLGDDAETRGMMNAMMNEMPLRELLMVGLDAMSPRRLDGLIAILNGHLWQGLRLIAKKQ